MKLVIHDRSDEITHVALSGRFDATEMQDIEKPLAEAVVGHNRPTVVDLSGIEFISSLGIGLLFANSKKLKKAGHKLVLLNPQGMVKEVLKSCKMDKVMPIVHDLHEAIQMLTSVPGKTSGTDPQPRSPIASAAPGQRQPISKVGSTVTDALKMPIRNHISELKSLYDAVAVFLKRHAVPYRPGYAVNLALEELVVNIINHAFFDDDAHLIDVELCMTDEQIILRIMDDGRPFDPRESTVDPRELDDPEVGGLGLILVLDIVDKLKYARVENKNCVEVCVHRREEAGSDPVNSTVP